MVRQRPRKSRRRGQRLRNAKRRTYRLRQKGGASPVESAAEFIKETVKHRDEHKNMEAPFGSLIGTVTLPPEKKGVTESAFEIELNIGKKDIRRLGTSIQEFLSQFYDTGPENFTGNQFAGIVSQYSSEENYKETFEIMADIERKLRALGGVETKRESNLLLDVTEYPLLIWYLALNTSGDTVPLLIDTVVPDELENVGGPPVKIEEKEEKESARDPNAVVADRAAVTLAQRAPAEQAK